MSSQQVQDSHRLMPHIEGLRAFSVLAVVAHHLGVLPRGFLGVDTFFVISGFLITGLLLDDLERNGRVHLLAFYGRRARRILPLASLVIVVSVLLVVSQGSTVKTQTTAEEGVWASTFLANFHYLDLSTDYFSTTQYPVLRNFWSLAVEEQFYLLWPLILLVVGLAAKRHWQRAGFLAASAITAISLYAGVSLGNSNPNASYFMPHTRAYELGLGAIVAFVVRKGRLSGLPAWAGNAATLALVATFLIATPTYNPTLQALPTVLLTAVVLVVGITKRMVVLESKILTYIGSRSFGWYLWHWPLLVIFALDSKDNPTITALLLIALIAFGLSDLTYRVFENPIRRHKRLQNEQGLAIATGLSFAVAALGISFYFTQDRAENANVGPTPSQSSSSEVSPTPTNSQSSDPTSSASPTNSGSPSATTPSSTAAADPKIQELVGPLKGTTQKSLLAEVQRVIQGAIDAEAFPYKTLPRLGDIVRDRSAWFENGCSVDFPSTDVPDCVGGDINGTRTLVLYGDSHATMWMPAFDRIGKNSGWKVVLFAKLACPLVEENVWSYQLNKPFTECQDWQSQVLPRIEALKPEMIVVTDQWKPAVKNGAIDDSGVVALWQRAFQPALERLAGYTEKLVVLGNLPNMSSDPATCLSTRGTDPWICTTLRDDAEYGAVQTIEKRAALAVKAKYVAVMPWACTVQFCPTVIGGRVAYFDQWHFTDTYVAWLEPLLKVAVGLE